jgi:hypothetical protein
MSGISSDREFEEPRRRKRRSKEEQDAARWRAQVKGGREEDYYEQWDAEEAQGEYKDDALISDGFKKVAEYAYTDPNGKLLYQALRYEHTSVPNAKKFRQRRKGPNGTWLADAGRVKVPYRWPELVKRPDELTFYTEGEKDADRLASLGLLATTVAGQQWSPEAAKALKGRDVVILGDHDVAGRDNVTKAVDALTGFVSSVRVVKLPGLSRTEDVSDWLDKGHSKNDLLALVAKTRPAGLRLVATGLIVPHEVPPRKWVYKPDYIRQFVSLLMSTGGVGKSSLVIAEALALVSGKPLLNVKPAVPEGEKLRVWYWNGEDPLDELHRRFAAAQKHFRLTAEDMGDEHLFINSGRLDPIVIAEDRKRVIHVNDAEIERIIDMLRKQKIDVAIIDPFVTTHRVPENDNGAIDAVVKAWNRIAEETNTAVMLVHHSRKPNGNEMTVDDARGASALLAAARSARAVNGMTKDEAKEAELPEAERRRYFCTTLGKTNLTRAPEDRTWFKIESIDLENGLPFGDEVGVVTPWTFPKVDMPPITPGGFRTACQKIRAGGWWRDDQQVTKEPWVGIPIAQAFGYDLSRPQHKKAVAKIVKDWIAGGTLIREQRPDPHRELKWYVTVGDEQSTTTGNRADPAPAASSAVPDASTAGLEEVM